jgi:hypothetical protein
MVFKVGDWARQFFGSSGATPADARRLSATSVDALGTSLRGLPAGERGWITLAEAARLFSAQEPQYAFGEMDDDGNARLAEFAAQHRCLPEFMPTEGRLYFRRPS